LTSAFVYPVRLDEIPVMSSDEDNDDEEDNDDAPPKRSSGSKLMTVNDSYEEEELSDQRPKKRARHTASEDNTVAEPLEEPSSSKVRVRNTCFFRFHGYVC
jgi:hypothetical protein